MRLPLETVSRPAASVSHLSFESKWASPVALIRALGLEQEKEPFVLLDSAGGSTDLCHYSFLAWAPRLTLRVRPGGKCELRSGGKELLELECDDPFTLLRQLLAWLAPFDSPDPAGLGVPLAGGAFGMVSYDAGRYIERLPALAADDLNIPELAFIFPRRLLVFDHRQDTAHLFFEDAAAGELETVREAMHAQVRQADEQSADEEFGELERHAFSLSAVTRSNMSRESFEHMVRRAKQYIVAGDIFQSNLSQRLELEFAGTGVDLYRALRAVNPSPFAGYLDFGDFQLISSSPERLVQLDGRSAQTRPIAGTRRRGVDFAEDSDMTAELNLDPKERAEHIMLVDLERNDMGRVCDYGSVRVDELMVNERYSHVIHIVSNVKGELHHARDAIDLLKAMFPGGTITGCPKVRCMQIIDELEPVRRGPYTGSFGYIGYGQRDDGAAGGGRPDQGSSRSDAPGNMDMNIIIRSLLRCGDKVYAQAGAGIVADSDPAREYRETLRKAEAMVRAVEAARRRARRAKPDRALAD